MSRLTDWMDRRLYPGFENDWDSLRFRDAIAARIKPDSRVLDFGAGRGKVADLSFRGKAALVAGVDVDPAVRENPYLDEARVMDAREPKIPYPDATFDVAFASNVLEHLDDPVSTLSDVARVLRPGGVFLAKTPNLRHYVAVIASLTPHAFHVWINRVRGRASRDTFPTHYRCNTLSAARRIAETAGFDVVDLSGWEGRPEYLRMSAPTYAFGYVYERIVNATSRLAGFRAVIVLTLRKR